MLEIWSGKMYSENFLFVRNLAFISASFPCHFSEPGANDGYVKKEVAHVAHLNNCNIVYFEDQFYKRKTLRLGITEFHTAHTKTKY